MSAKPRDYFRRKGTYSQHTHRPLNCLVFLLPMIVAFHVGALGYRTNLLAWRDVNRLLKYFGAAQAYLPALLLVLVLFFQQIARRDPWRVQPLVLAGMLGESLLGILPLIALSHLTGKIVMNSALQAAPASTAQEVLSGLGAAVYEGFIFRMLLIGLFLLVFTDLLGLDKHIVALAALIVSAVLFSLYHYSGDQISGRLPMPWEEFAFRALAGAYLGGVFLVRGFGVSAGVHAAYNVYVSLMSMSGGA